MNIYQVTVIEFDSLENRNPRYKSLGSNKSTKWNKITCKRCLVKKGKEK